MRPEEPPSRPAGHTAPAMTGSTPVGYAGDDDDDPMDDGVIRDADGQPSRAIELGVAPMSGAKRNWASNADVPEVQEWLATDRIPLGEITLLCGEEGIGKSLFWVWLVALLTTGRGCPEFGIEPGPPRYVFVIATEDAWGKTVAPRLKAAGADMDYIGYTATDVDEGVPIMPHDFPLLTDPWDGKEPALIVVDAWVDTTESSVKLPHVREARASIVPWRKVAQELNTAVLLLTHTNRDTSGELRNRYGNSGELRKLARAALFATKGEEPDEMLVALDKANLATQRHHSLLFTGEMVTVRARRSDGTWTDTPIRRLTLAGEDPRRIDEVLRERADDAADRDSRDCKTWLRDYMVRNQGSAKATEVQSAARAEGYSVSTLRRARVALGVTSSKHVDHYIWSM